MDFSESQIERYARHIVLREVGGVGQAKLLAAKVLIVGAGGLGSPLAMYLAAAGVGTLGLVDDDTVSLSNLQRQIVHTTSRIGDDKTSSAAQTLSDLNPDTAVIEHKVRLTADNAMALIADYDIVADGSDNFATRFLINDACYLAGKTLVAASMLKFEGQISTFRAHQGGDNPCYRCLYPAAPAAGIVPSCAEGGIFGALAGVMGSMQGVEIIKEILEIGDSQSGWLSIYDALAASWHKIKLKPAANCPLCGPQKTILDLSSHAA
ncbi:MAG: molybdopterin-synthase adenylyltransferase MoeB [Alphaproteobacteria bacterium]|jgi:molybdopterin-synthase adenylyltransferase|nr:molybdopterin-synthase adenylyltransferase MoeB [Alphaproteobacteria bacterium]MBT4084822.1 molybdopterin-synthase adenylyltransferase MoeB [Alphaproteobacteria bacterium]MBT4544778.1 molybdopterin-synthase adenylyltransferase MoeB [Alphaproteobacteria bacterium]MBT5919861.1 molybdopterin-synthase adenylyltransferase MoeB [Alphaproteobacteria bacterium]MBT6386036.1 molybdopterin-synthase adenylyltransferase MoeB [Alphaproteobacteria bacterium]